MAVFPPILRLLLLFLNVYESYKTLKPPPPSSRNPARPSVRAVTQRKRDMKGCLAVWIVWVSLALYERVLESLVSLFIPFYDEFKSLVLLFLIVTRARGAEPIYLHLIRPIIRPYTGTLDSALELMLMIGDFLIALSSFPLQIAMRWSRKQFARFAEPLSDGSSDESSNEDDISEVSSTFFAPSGQPSIPSARGGDIQSLRKSSNDIPNKNHRPYVSPGARRKPGSQENVLDPNVTTSDSSAKRPSSSHHLPTAENENGETGLSRYQIYYPPAAAYPDNGIRTTELDRTIRPLVSVQVREQVMILAEQQTDEWRQYPPFPSAYPPTPIATTSRLVLNSVGLSPSIYPPIPEEVNQQDFHRSLLPPRGPLNPSPAGNWSDQVHNHSGISPFLESDVDDSISSDGRGNEDGFNVTLKTPPQLKESMRSMPPNLHLSPRPISTASSNFSVPSRSSALTTVDNGSPLRTDTWSDSSVSSAAFNRLPASVIGKKRSHPRTAKGRVRRVEEEPHDYESSDLQHLSSSSYERRSITPFSRPQALERLASVSASDPADSITHSTSSLEHNEVNDDREQVPSIEKRRRVTKSPPMRSVNSPRSVRTSRISSPHRTRTHATMVSRKTRSNKRRLVEAPAYPKRESERLKAGSRGGSRGQGSGTNITELSIVEGATRARIK